MAAAAAPAPAQPKSSSNDLFDLDLGGLGSDLGSANHQQAKSAGDDLFQLSGANPFMQNIVNQAYTSQQAAPMMMANPFQANSKSISFKSILFCIQGVFFLFSNFYFLFIFVIQN